MKFLYSVLVFVVLLPIYLYRFFLSPFVGRYCNFYPTCSMYMILSIKKYGIVMGIVKGLKRIGRCNPMNKEFIHDEP